MNSSIPPSYKKFAIYPLTFIFLLFITSRIYATDQIPAGWQPPTPLVPNLAEITNTPPQFAEALYRGNPEELNTFTPDLADMQPIYRPDASFAVNASSPAPFAPTGHFESTLMPISSNIAVGLQESVFVYGSGYFGGYNTAVSHNQGLTWRAIEHQSIKTIGTSPLNPNHVLLGSDNGIQISHDAGITWQSATTTTGGITQIAFSPTYSQDNQIFAATNGGYNTPGKLIRSTNGGFTWTPVTIPTLPNHFALAPNFNSSQKMIAANGSNGVLFTENGGQTWTNRSTGLDLNYSNYIKEVFFSPAYATDNTIFALTDYGVYRSKSSGVTWSRLLPYSIKDFALHPNYGSNKTLFMNATVDSNGDIFNVLFRSPDNGQTFQGMVAEVNDFALSPNYASNKTIFVQITSGAYITTDGFNGLVRSTDDGQTWYIRSETVPNAQVEDLIPSPAFATDQTVFLIRQGSVDGIYAYSVWKTTNLGFSWEMVTLPRVIPSSPIKIALSANYANDQTILLLLSEGDTTAADLYKSVDGGQNWTLLNGNLPIEAFRDPNLELSPNYAQDQTIFISDYTNGLFRSNNDGQTWQQLSSEYAITHIAIAPEYPTDDRLFISMYNDGISRSDNDGATWTSPTDPAGPNLLIALSPNFLQDDTVFVAVSGSSGGGAWKSVDAGNSWENVSGSSLRYFHKAMALSSSFTQDQTLVVHTESDFLYISEDAGATWFILNGVNFGYEPVGLALPYWQGKPFPMTANSDGFYVYVWPWQTSAAFQCAQNLSLSSTETQGASIQLGLKAASPGQWRVSSADVAGISWLSIAEPEGMLPQLPQLAVDSSLINAPNTAVIGVDIFLSHRQYLSLDVPVFMPCWSSNLPLIAR